MASIRKYTLADGKVRYRCDIVIKKQGKFAHRENKSFSKGRLAWDQGKRREIELQEKDAFLRKFNQIYGFSGSVV